MNLRKLSGFTLIELMSVVVVIAILVAVAYPSYQDHVRKAKRTEGRTSLLKIAQTQERFFSDRNRYANQTELAAAVGVTAGTVIYSGENPNLAQGSAYTIAVDVVPAPALTYILTATPNAPFTDSDCGNLTVNQAGVRGFTATATATNTPKCRW